MVTFVQTLLLGTTVLAAYTDEFLQAFRNLGLDPWAGMEMDVAWGHATLRPLQALYLCLPGLHPLTSGVLSFQANMDQQLKIHQNVEKSIDVRDRSELKGIRKPHKFSGASGTWDSWYYKFKTWVESCHKNAIQVIQKFESTVDVAVTDREVTRG